MNDESETIRKGVKDIDIIKTYQNQLANYSSEQLYMKPALGEWSVCQVFDHCVIVAHEYLDAAEGCGTRGENTKEGKTSFGAALFERGGFPPIKIRLPDEMNEPPINTYTSDELNHQLQQLQNRIQDLEPKIAEMDDNLKIKHGGFGWLNAKEWFALVDMHFHHHIRQLNELNEKMGR